MQVLDEFRGQPHVFVAANRFGDKKSPAGYVRHRDNLAALTAVYADLDTHTVPEYAGQFPEHIAEQAEAVLADNGYPSPTAWVFSGRGLQGWWVLREPLPPSRLPEWERANRSVFNVLREFGADVKVAGDAARLLRAPDTVNVKSNKTAYVLPSSRFTTHKLSEFPVTTRVQVQGATPPDKPSTGLTTAVDGKRPHARITREYAEACQRVLEDMDVLRGIRDGWDTVPVGHRTSWVTVYAVALAHAHGYLSPNDYTYRVVDFGMTVCGLPRREAEQATGTLRRHYAEDKEASAPFRWQWTLTHMSDVLGVAPHEFPYMSALVPDKDTRNARKAERWRRKRGQVTRAEYLTACAESRDTKRQDVQRLRAEGMTVQQVADALGVSESTVQRYSRGGVSESVTVTRSYRALGEYEPINEFVLPRVLYLPEPVHGTVNASSAMFAIGDFTTYRIVPQKDEGKPWVRKRK